MKPNELFEQIQNLVKDGNLDKAKAFLEENKDNFGEYFEQAKALFADQKGLDGLVDKVKGLFGGK